MAKIERTEEEIYQDLVKYIASKKCNRPSGLAPIKRTQRTKKIVDLVFSNPKTFKLEVEINHLPDELRTDEYLIKAVLARLASMEFIKEDELTPAIMVAYEFSKRRTEYISALWWGSSGEKFKYPKSVKGYLKDVSDLCDKLEVSYRDQELLEDYNLYVNTVSKAIIKYFKDKEIQLQKQEMPVIKYRDVEVVNDRKVLILISGVPDSGKTTFGMMLSSVINNSIAFDSDQLMSARNFNKLPDLVGDKYQVIIFSDTHANTYFTEAEKEDYDVVEILIKPDNVEKMYRHSKYMQGIPFNEYVACEIRDENYSSYNRDITVVNDYTSNLWLEVNRTIEALSDLIGFSLPGEEGVKLTYEKPN